MIILFIIVIGCIVSGINAQAHRIPQPVYEFCGHDEIYSSTTPNLYKGYSVVINRKLPLYSEIKVKLDSIGRVFTGYFEKLTGVIKLWPEAPDKFCGRRRITDESLPLIVSGSSTRAGHWPWHAAINRLSKGVQKYICGGTLISKFLILTAAHCATIRGVAVNPEILGVTLGKHSLYDIEVTNQGVEVFEVIIHGDFDKRTLDNDIALLKLTTEVIFNNFVQPACIWFDGIYDKMPSFEITGTVVGWGIDQSESLSKKLRSATLPVVPDVTCIRYEPVFYTNMLNGKKFCAGNANGTAACNGDSGGAFLVFVEDDKERATKLPLQRKPGAWYVKGIVSATLVQKESDICDPAAYTVYTDVAKYRSWILSYMPK